MSGSDGATIPACVACVACVAFSAAAAAACVAFAAACVTPPIPAVPHVDSGAAIARERERERELERYVLGPVLDDSEPPVDDEGYDASRITIDNMGGADVSWLPLIDGGRKGVPFVDVTARSAKRGDVTFPALLDTGAQISLLPRAIVDDVGAVPVLDEKGEPLVRGMVDALGGTSFAAIVEVPLIVLGHLELERVRAAVPLDDNDHDNDNGNRDHASRPTLATWPVIGFPELARMDVLLAADSGVVGVFAAGAAPPLANAKRVKVAIADAAPFVVARTRDGREVRMVLDTGASSTTLPRALGLAEEPGLGETVRVLGGRAAVGRAFAPPLWLGAGAAEPPVALAVRAVDLTNSGVGLLGGDALMEHRALLRARDGVLELAPARWGSARRMKWRGRPCANGAPCIDARLIRCPPSRGALDQTCVELAVDSSIDMPLAIDVRLFDDKGSLRPRAMTAVFPKPRTDGLALPALPAHPTRIAIRVRRPALSEDCKQGSVCWWN